MNLIKYDDVYSKLKDGKFISHLDWGLGKHIHMDLHGNIVDECGMNGLAVLIKRRKDVSPLFYELPVFSIPEIRLAVDKYDNWCIENRCSLLHDTSKIRNFNELLCMECVGKIVENSIT